MGLRVGVGGQRVRSRALVVRNTGLVVAHIAVRSAPVGSVVGVGRMGLETLRIAVLHFGSVARMVPLLAVRASRKRRPLLVGLGGGRVGAGRLLGIAGRWSR